MPLLRTDEMENKYHEHRKTNTSGVCALCINKPIQEFKYWKIMKNNFPYNIIASKHDMIVTKRHVKEDDLNIEEIEELNSIKNSVLHKEYDFIMEATYKVKSIPNHHHMHLVNIKEKIL